MVSSYIYTHIHSYKSTSTVKPGGAFTFTLNGLVSVVYFKFACSAQILRRVYRCSLHLIFRVYGNIGQQSNHCRSRKSICGDIPMFNFLPFYIAYFLGCNSVTLHLYESKQRPEHSATLLLSVCSCCITRRCP